MSEEVKQEPELELTDAQKDAIYTIDKNVAVSAGAGSGKTQVLSLRFLFILEKLGLEAFLASPSGDGALQAKAEQIMAVTFTKAAATQMRERIRKAMNKRIAKAEAAIGEDDNAKIVRFWRLQLKSLEKAHIDTLHSLCSKILRENPVDAGIDPQFRVAEDVEGKVFVKDTIVDFVRRGLRNGDQDITKLAGIYGYQSLCDNLYSLYSKIEDILADEQAKVRYSDAVAENENVQQAAQNLIKQIEHLIEKKDEVTNNGSEGRNKLDKLAAAFEQIKGDLLQKKPSYDSCTEYFNNLRL